MKTSQWTWVLTLVWVGVAGAEISGPVAVIPSVNSQDQELAQQLVDMTTSLLGQTKRFTVVERSRLEEVLKEQELWAAGAVSDSQAIELGRLLGASYACVISVEQDKSLWGISVSLRFVNVEKGTVEEVVSAHAEDVPGLRRALERALIQTFRSRGIVEQTDAGYCAISVGREQGAKQGAFYKVIQGDRIKRQVGLIRVDETFPNYSVARLIRGNAMPGDTLVETHSPKRGDASGFYGMFGTDTVIKSVGARFLFDDDCNFFGPDLRLVAMSWGDASAYGVQMGAFKGSLAGPVMIYVSASMPILLANQADQHNVLYGFNGSAGLDLWLGNFYLFAEAGGLYLTPFSSWDQVEELPQGDMETIAPGGTVGFGVRF